MKQFHLKAFALFLLLLPLCAVRGQSVVTEVQYTKSDTTIVRHWTEGISIVYTHNSDNDNYFLLVDPTVVQVRRIAVPSYVTVNDFRILHDSVFLCGHVDIDVFLKPLHWDLHILYPPFLFEAVSIIWEFGFFKCVMDSSFIPHYPFSIPHFFTGTASGT